MDRPHEPVSPQPGEAEESGHDRSPYGFRPVALLVTDTGGRISEADRGALRLLNSNHKRLSGRPFSTLVSPHHRALCRRHITRVRMGGEAASWTVLMQPHQRQAVLVDLTVVPVCGRGGMVTSLRWVLQEKRHRRLESLNQELDAVLQGLAGIRWSLDAAESRVRGIRGEPETVSSIADVMDESQRFLLEAQRSLWRLSQ